MKSPHTLMSSLFFLFIQSTFIISINDKKTNVQQQQQEKKRNERKHKSSIVSDTHTNTYRHTNKDYHQET
jgi:hypothetical protein